MLAFRVYQRLQNEYTKRRLAALPKVDYTKSTFARNYIRDGE